MNSANRSLKNIRMQHNKPPTPKELAANDTLHIGLCRLLEKHGQFINDGFYHTINTDSAQIRLSNYYDLALSNPHLKALRRPASDTPGRLVSVIRSANAIIHASIFKDDPEDNANSQAAEVVSFRPSAIPDGDNRSYLARLFVAPLTANHAYPADTAVQLRIPDGLRDLRLLPTNAPERQILQSILES